MSRTSLFFSRFAQLSFYQWAALMGLALLATTVFYTVPAWSGPRWAREVFVWPLVAILSLGYWQGFLALQRQSVSLKAVWVSGLLLGLLALLIPPFHSTDLFGYINRGWQQWHYGLNPYVFTVDHIPGWEQDPMITDHWVNNPSPYGFLYLQLAKLLCALGGGQKGLTVGLFKAFNGLLFALTGWLIALGVRKAADRYPQIRWLKPPKALYLYLWNPLVWIHSLSNGHNDIVMGFFVTGAGVCALLGSWLWVLPTLMAATLIKYGAVVIVPLAILFLAKNRAWAALLGGVGLSALLFVSAGAPYLPDWQRFHLSEINRNAFVSHGSLHALLYTLFKMLDKTLLPMLHPYRTGIRALLKNLLLASYALFLVRLCWQRCAQPGYPPPQWLRDALLAMAVLVGLVSLKFYPWYLAMFFPLALMLPAVDWLQRALVIVSCAQLLSITFVGQAHLLNFLLMTGLPAFWLMRQRYLHTQPSGCSLSGEQSS